MKIDLKSIFLGVSQTVPLGNVVRKLHPKFHSDSSIRKLSKIGGDMAGRRRKKQGILNPFWLQFKVA